MPLEPRAVQVLRYLASQHGRIVTKDELLEKVWIDVFTTDAVLKKAISQVRRALGDDAEEARFIRTWHARGYEFIALVRLSETLKEDAKPPAKPPVSAPPPNAVDPDYDQLVGRAGEFAALCVAFRRTLKKQGQPVVVTGDSGSGKTQLARRFRRWANTQGAQCLYARFFDYRGSQRAPFETFLSLLRAALGQPVSGVLSQSQLLSSGEIIHDLRALVEVRCGVTLPEALFAPSTQPLATVEGHTGTSLADQFRAVVPLGKSFIRLSRQRPLVLLLDDVQWADEASREIIGYLMRVSESEPLLLVTLMRNEESLDATNPVTAWLKEQATYRSYTGLALAPLNEAECRQLIEAVFSNGECAPDLPAADLRTLHRTTGGNPYFLTETLRLLVANGAITTATGASGKPRYQWHGIQDFPLPDNLVLAAQDKLGRLPATVRPLIEAAAVLGDEFRVETLALLMGQTEAEVETVAREAARCGVLSERGVSAEADFRFHHTMLRRVAYDQLTQRQRRRSHAQAALALEQAFAHEADRVAEAISAHHEAAGDVMNTFTWSLRAWRAAATRWQWRTAVACLERVSRAAEQLSSSDPSALTMQERLRYLIGLGESYRATGRLRESEQTLLRALSLAETFAETSLIGETAYQLAQTSFARGQYETTVAQAERAHQLLKDTAESGTATFAWLQAVSAKLALGDYAAADLLTAMIPPAAQAPDAQAIVALELLGWARVLQGRRSEGSPQLERALTARLSAGDVRQAAHLRRRLHLGYFSQGKYDASFAAAWQAREDFRATGDAFGEAKASACLGQTRIAQGCYEEGLTFLNRTLASLHTTGDEHCEAEALWLLGRAQTALGQYDAAQQSLTRALAMIRTISDRDDEFRFLNDLARLHLARHALTEAEQAAQAARTIAESLHNDEGVACALIELSCASLLQDHPRDAAAQAERAVKALDHENPQDRSGECWRAYWTWGKALLALQQDTAALAALRRAVTLLNELRAQFGEHDKLRYELATQNLAQPARELYGFLLQLNQTEEAAALAQSWQINH